MNLKNLDVQSCRARFPSLATNRPGGPLIFLDNPGGTQTPDTVISSVADYYRQSNANVGGAFETSNNTDAIVSGARAAMADLLNAASESEIIFGPNMTTLTFHLSRSIGRDLRPGDEIIVTDLDHDANVAPWMALEEMGARIRVVPVEPDTTLTVEALRSVLTDRTRLVAFTYASNAVGTVTDVAALTAAAKESGALVFVDAVQYAPHGPIDVQQIGCDFLAVSSYKFFGPHQGIVYGRKSVLDALTPYKVRPAKDTTPWRWETGTQNHECMAGVTAAVDYLAGIGGELAVNSRRSRLAAGMRAIRAYEQDLSRHLIKRLSALPGVTVHGISDAGRTEERVPTVAFTWERMTPRETAEYLGRNRICTWSGNYYAVRLMERLGLEQSGGAVRIGAAHYNTREEIDRVADLLEQAPL